MLSLYVHFPFCLKKCLYCGFNSYELKTIDEHDWLKKYGQALAFFAQRIEKQTLSSIYFGGGTPSLMSSFMLEGIIDYAEKLFGFNDGIEISLEANPGTINQNMVNNFKAIGINRLSLGVQSFNDDELQFLGRIHNAEQAIEAIKFSQKIFDNLSIDLIYGLSGQTLTSWSAALKQAVDFNCQHYSLYQLSIEPESQFHLAKIKTLDEELLTDFLIMNRELMELAGFPPYEISNYAKKGRECRHNMLCWQGYNYLGIGAGACGRMGLEASQQNPNPKEWFINPADTEITALTKTMRALELLITGFRMIKGIDQELFLQNCQLELFECLKQPVLDEMIRDKLLKIEGKCLKTTPKGLMAVDYLLPKLIK